VSDDRRTIEQLEMDAFLSKADTLASLVEHPAWAEFLTLLTDMRQAGLEELARCSKPKELRFWQGVASAIQEIIERPARIVQAASEAQQAEETEDRGVRLDLRALLGTSIHEETL